MTSKKLSLFGLFLLCLFAGGARAATIVWTNTTGGNWSVAANWSPNQVPTSSDAIIINAAGTYVVTVQSAQSAGTVMLGGSGSTPPRRGAHAARGRP